MTKLVNKQQQLIIESLDYARNLSRRFHAERKGCGFGLDDFESAAFLGLCDAARRYNPDSEVSFNGFAFLRIQGEMNDLLRSSGFVTRKQVSAIANLLGEAAEPQALKRIVRSLNLNLKHFQEIILDHGIRLHFDEYDLVTDISYSDALNPEQQVEEKILSRFLREMIQKLSDKERLVIELKYFEDLTFEEMREQFNGATRSWLCRIHTKALESLRANIIAAEVQITALEKAA
jgi:RNA polymerase sigma factor for flagellar operon FliA